MNADEGRGIDVRRVAIALRGIELVLLIIIRIRSRSSRQVGFRRADIEVENGVSPLILEVR